MTETEDEQQAAPQADEPQPGEIGIPEYDSIPYTRPRQVSPGRERGRKGMRGRERKALRGESLWKLMHGSESKLFEFCVDAGLLTNCRPPVEGPGQQGSARSEAERVRLVAERPVQGHKNGRVGALREDTLAWRHMMVIDPGDSIHLNQVALCATSLVPI